MQKAAEALGRVVPFQHETQRGRAGDELVTLITKAGQTIYLTRQEANDMGVRCIGSGQDRVCQFGVFRDDRGAWIYPPQHAPDDLDGSQYRQAYQDRVEDRYFAHRQQRKDRPARTPETIAGFD